MAFQKKNMPETELERVIAAQEDAVREAEKAAIAAERQRIYAEREAALRVMRQPEVQRAAAPTPAQQAASIIRAAVGDRWNELVALTRLTRPAEIRDRLMFIADTEAADRRHAEVVQMGADRRAIQAAEDAAREARRAAVIETAA